MHVLAGLSRPDDGTARLLGEPSRLAGPVLARVGVAIGGPAVVPHLSRRRNLEPAWRAGGRRWPSLGESLLAYLLHYDEVPYGAPVADMTKFARLLVATVLLAVGLASTGCSGSGPGPGPTSGSRSTPGPRPTHGPGGSGLEAALALVPDTPGFSAHIYYDNTAELASLAGNGTAVDGKGYAQLRGMGAGAFMMLYLAQLPGDTGINLLNESYAVSAGGTPTQVTLVAGGQNGPLVATRIARLGWKEGADGVLAGPFTVVHTGEARYVIPFQRVRTVNSDVLTGGPKADLSQLGSPSGPALIDDPGVRALADCLGDVVAAAMVSGQGYGIEAPPTEMAMGISQPANASATPQMVACVSWPTQQAADAYAVNVTKALATGESFATLRPYSALLRHPTVTSVGGATHIVEWRADPVDVALLLQVMDRSEDLPALTDCGRWPGLAPAAAKC